MAGLPDWSAIVCVGPPLPCRDPSFGSVPKRLLLFVPLRVLPEPVVGAVANSEFVALMVPPRLTMSLAPVVSVLLEKIVLVMVAVKLFSTRPPPLKEVELPEIVQLVSVRSEAA